MKLHRCIIILFFDDFLFVFLEEVYLYFVLQHLKQNELPSVLWNYKKRNK